MFYSGGFFDLENKENHAAFTTTKKDKDTGESDKKKWKTFVPVTLKMLIESKITQSDSFEIEGESVNDVIIWGRLLSREELPTRTIFEVNDSTGSMRVTFYNREENVLPNCFKNLDYEHGMYAKIFGNARVFKEAKAIVGAWISKITDFDELCNHYLQVFIGSAVRTNGILPSEEISNEKSKAKTIEEVHQILKTSIERIKLTKLQITKEDFFDAVKAEVNYCDFEKGLNLLIEDMQIFQESTGELTLTGIKINLNNNYKILYSLCFKFYLWLSINNKIHLL